MTTFPSREDILKNLLLPPLEEGPLSPPNDLGTFALPLATDPIPLVESLPNLKTRWVLDLSQRSEDLNDSPAPTLEDLNIALAPEPTTPKASPPKKLSPREGIVQRTFERVLGLLPTGEWA